MIFIPFIEILFIVYKSLRVKDLNMYFRNIHFCIYAAYSTRKEKKFTRFSVQQVVLADVLYLW